MNRPMDILRLIRPDEWIKNGFVFVGILFTPSLITSHLLWQVILSAIAFCFISSSMYVFNDIMDIENDKYHPKKRNRPLSTGLITPKIGWLSLLTLAILGFVIGGMVSYKIVMILLAYVILIFSYTIYLKNIVILDVFCISAGFLLRIMAGTNGLGIQPSKWLLLCSLMLTLFLGFTKRRAEVLALGNYQEEARKVLENYGPILLDELIGICTAGVIITYSLYTVSDETTKIHQTENLFYTVPLVIYALFRYIYLLHHQSVGENPSRDVFHDPHILVSVIGWFALTMYLIGG